MIKLRPYQQEAVDSIWMYFQKNRGNPLVVMPTATGKSVVIAAFIQSIFKWFPNQKILVVTHVKELIEQNFEKLTTLWPNAPVGINSAGLGKRDWNFPILFAGVASVAKNAQNLGHVDLVLVDEAHLISPNDETMYGKLFSQLKAINPLLKVIGFTATPWRLGHGQITDNHLFTDICFDISTVQAFNRLIAEGYLAPLVPKRAKTKLDLDGVHIRGGDFVLDELQHAVDKEILIRAAIREALEHGEDRKRWLVFCSGIDHSEHTAEIMNEMGIDTRAVHSQSKDRDVHYRMYKEGRLTALTNNNVLTTGVDVPDIDMILMLRPTLSTVLWVQMLGRGTRVAPGKTNCLVLDFAGNTARLGPINDPIIPKKKGSKGGEAPVKVCPKCDTYNHASVRFCTECGHEFIFASKLEMTASDQNLIAGDIPEIHSLKVEHVTYEAYHKADKPPSMKVSYYTGLNRYTEYVCFEHQGFALMKAKQWWGRRAKEKMMMSENPWSQKPVPCPPYTDEALTIVESMPVPTHIKVLVNKKYPEIIDVCFNGTNFGTEDKPIGDLHVPSVESAKPVGSTSGWNKPGFDDNDDDIPF